MHTIPQAVWQQRYHQHQQRTSAYADAYLERRSRGEKHPVEDFLFTYYSHSPGKLKRWLPALGERLEFPEPLAHTHAEMPGPDTVLVHEVFQLAVDRIPASTLRAAAFIAQLCENILLRPGRFSCFGLHEWAMVYKQPAEKIRHQGYELRLSEREIADFVESQNICCSHYDAYRFFTPEAAPFNTLRPSLETRLQMEQPGCLHANMDLYKWAYKLWPWCGSDLVAECFHLAMKTREMDMRASPYDLKAKGYTAIPIETAVGRMEYEKEQRIMAEVAQPLREKVLLSAQLILESGKVLIES
jgi:hypothetical protein